MPKLEAWWMVRREGEPESYDECLAWAREILRQHPEASVYIDGHPFTKAYEGMAVVNRGAS